jgi:hypothetical protein
MNSEGSHCGKISQVRYIKGKLLFPISWLQKQDYCEYQIYLENVRGLKAEPTKAMVEGQQEHDRLYTEFVEKAVPATMDDMLTESRTAKILSRELRVENIEYGIFGFIDEIWLTPDNFVIIDDKPGVKAYTSSIRQVFGYCLAFKSITGLEDNRPIMAALRNRGTDNIYWLAPFDHTAEEEIISLIMHTHDLLSGKVEFSSSSNINKCRSCR